MNVRSSQGTLKLRDWLGIVGTVMGSVFAASTFVYSLYDKRASKIEQIIADHEIRITKREANAFTSQQANELSTAVTRLSIELVQQQKAIERHQQEASKISDALSSLTYSLRTTPNDVLGAVQKIEKRIEDMEQTIGRKP